MVNCVCRYCGSNFAARVAAIKRGGGKYCNRQCAGLANVVEAITRICHCGVSFTVRPICKSRITCSNKCAKTRKLSQESKDKIAIALGQERINGKYVRICTFCGSHFMSVSKTNRCDLHRRLHLSRAKKWDRAIAKLAAAFDVAAKSVTSL